MTPNLNFKSLRQLLLDAERKTDFEREALDFINGFAWCERVDAFYEGLQVPTVIGVFLVQIRPARPEVDEWLWIVVGDLPPAYLVAEENPTPEDAISGYIREMKLWVQAAHEGRSVDGLIPVNVPPSKEYADMLGSRLRTLEAHFFPSQHAPRMARKRKSK